MKNTINSKTFKGMFSLLSKEGEMEKKTDSKMETEILAIPFIIKKEKKGYSAESVDLNIVTQGSNLKEARKNIREAIKLHLKSVSELGMV